MPPKLYIDGINLMQAPQQAGFGTGYDNSYSGGYGQQQSAPYQPAPQPAPVAHFAPQSSGSMQPGSASYSSQMGGGYAPPAPQAPAYSAQPSRVGLLSTLSIFTQGYVRAASYQQGVKLCPSESDLETGFLRGADRQLMSWKYLLSSVQVHIMLVRNLYCASGTLRAACRHDGER